MEIGIISSPFEHAGQPHRYTPSQQEGECKCGEIFHNWVHFLVPPYEIGDRSRVLPAVVISTCAVQTNELGDISFLVLTFHVEEDYHYIEEWLARVDPTDYNHMVNYPTGANPRPRLLHGVWLFGDINDALASMRDPLGQGLFQRTEKVPI